MRSGIVWKFAPKGSRFQVQLRIERERGYKYDGDDPDGDQQRRLDDGDDVAFGSICEVLLDGEVIGTDSIWGSVYQDGTESEFWTAHRDPDPMNRNCSAMREARGGSPDARVSICHYFPDLVASAIDEARQYVHDMTVPPFVRLAA